MLKLILAFDSRSSRRDHLSILRIDCQELYRVAIVVGRARPLLISPVQIRWSTGEEEISQLEILDAILTV